jgi:hypothetical protein
MPLNKTELLALNQVNFPDNTQQLITPVLLRDFNGQMIGSMELTQSMDGYANLGTANVFYGGNQSIAKEYKLFTNGVYWNNNTAGYNNLEIINSITGNIDIAALGGGVRIVSSSLNITNGTFTASLAEGYTYVGNSSGRTYLVATSSFGGATSAITASSLITASFNNGTRNLTFTKGDASTFAVNIPDVSGSTINTGSFAITGSNTFIGNQIISGNVNITGSLTASGLAYPTTAGTAGQFMTTNGTNTLSFDDVHVLLEDVRYGESITLGDPLYVSGSNGTRPVVYKADASNTAKMPVIYVANSTNVANTNTTALTLGLITGVTTTGYTEGTTIYVAEGTAGWSASRPSGSASIVQALGIVTKTGPGGSGRGLVLNPGPATLPNLQTGYAWVGNGANQPVTVATSSFGSTINTGSFVTTSSFNSYTASNDQRVSSLETNSASVNISISNLNQSSASQQVSIDSLNSRSGSYATLGANTFTGSQTIQNSALTLNSTASAFLNVNATTQNNILFNSPATQFTSYGTFLFNNNGGAGGSGSLAFLATSSSISFNSRDGFIFGRAEPGQAANGMVKTNTISGSLILAPSGFSTNAADLLHLSSSSNTNNVNLIFKNSNTAADTIISGSGNIFSNPTAASAEFKRYIGGSGNIALLASAIPQITGSNQISPTFSNNTFQGAGFLMRTPVSSSTWTISGNTWNNLGNTNLGTAQATSFVSASAGVTISNNFMGGTLSATAYKTQLYGPFGIIQSYVGGTLTMNNDSSSITFVNSIQAGALTINNSYNSGLTTNANGLAFSAGNAFMGSFNNIYASGSNTTATTRQVIASAMIGMANSASVNLNGDNSQLNSVALIGHSLAVTGSSAIYSTAQTGSDRGTVIVGRFNKEVLSGNTVFVVGSGTSYSNRKNAILTDSGSNTFIEGTLSMSGSTVFTGSVKVAPTFQLNLPTGSNQQVGTAVLDGGTPSSIIVSNSLVTANSIIMVSKQTLTNLYSVAVSSKGAGTFTISSTGNVDTDTVGWVIWNNT